MRAAPLFLVLLLAGCGSGKGELDIVQIGPAANAPPAAAGPVPLEVAVRAGQLKSLLDSGAAADLKIFACGAPDGPGDTFPVTFGGEPLDSLSGDQISEDPDMLVLLNAELPRAAISARGRCAAFTGREGFDLASTPTPLPSPG